MVFKRRDKPPLFRRLRELLLPRRGWRRGIEYLGHRVRRLPDTPHRIALGFACGVYVSFTPFFGLHFVLAAVLARLCRGNILASLIGTAVLNPLTFPLIASISLWLGRRILGHGVTGRDFGRIADAFAQAFAGLWSSILSLVGLGESHWQQLVPFLRDLVWPYFLGGLLPGIVAAVLGYYLTRPIVAAYQARRRARMLARARERLAGEKSEADAAGARPYNPGGTGTKGRGAAR
jgi:uncharacterized protein (DUF2062 family)